MAKITERKFPRFLVAKTTLEITGIETLRNQSFATIGHSGLVFVENHRTVIGTHWWGAGVRRDGVDDLLAGYQPAAPGEVVPGASHRRHRGEAELVQVVENVMVQVC